MFSNRPAPIPPQLGQESVWDYPRPPRLEAVSKKVTIIYNGVTICETYQAQRVLETSHPPSYYLPPGDIQMQYLQISPQSSFCEWKGRATYYTLTVGDRQLINIAWSYLEPTVNFAAIKDYLAFYVHPMDACYVGEDLVTPQPGNFYGGWVTPDIVGPFKGVPNSWGW